MAVDGGEIKRLAGGNVSNLIQGIEDGDVDAGEAQRAIADLLDALIPSGPLEGVERALIDGAVGAVAGLVRRARTAKPERLKKRAEKLRARAEKLEKRAGGG